MTTISKCPMCGEKIKLSHKVWLGQDVICPVCDAELEVVNLNPVELDWVGEEDYYDDDEPEFDDDF